jgi:hypothetical protein
MSDGLGWWRFGLIWMGGLFDDTSSVFGWILGECHEFSRFTNVAACFLVD